MLLRTYLKWVKHKYMMTLISLVKIVGHYGKPVATIVPADYLALDLADSGQLPGCHSEHLHLGPPAGQQLSVGGEVDVVFIPGIYSHPIVDALKEMEAVASQSVPQSHLPALVPGCQDVSFIWTELHLPDF